MTAPGTCDAVSGERDDVSAVELGAGDGDFYSLGLGGGAVFEVDFNFAGPALFFEVTFAGSDHRESADIYVSTDGLTGVLVASIDNVISDNPQSVQRLVMFGGIWSHFLVVDTTLDRFGSSTGSVDGFDLDAIQLFPIPLPGAGLMLLSAAIVGLGVGRRKA